MRRRASLLSCLVFALCGCGAQAPQRTESGASQHGRTLDPNAPIGTLRVGLYPFVPRLEQMQAAIRAGWQQVEPRVVLDFAAWDGGYAQDPLAAGLDVFVFDALFLEDYRARGWLRPLQAAELGKPSDFVNYAIRGLLSDHAYSGIPLFGSAPLLFYRRGDAKLAETSTLSQLVNAVGTCTYSSALPPGPRGLIAGIATDLENARLYLAAAQAGMGLWPIPLPSTPDALDPGAVAALRTVLQAASYYDSTRDIAWQQRARWFASGLGQALVGRPESLAFMGPVLGEVDFTLLPLGDDPTVRRVFDAQLVGVNPASHHATWALDLARVMTSPEVLIASVEPRDGQPAQYLVPLRRSALRALGARDPHFRKFQQVIDRARPYLGNLGTHARAWLATAPAAIADRVRFNYPCGCEQEVAPIQSQSDASAKCLAACARYDGWSGEWRAPRGQPHTCDCRSCFRTR